MVSLCVMSNIDLFWVCELKSSCCRCFFLNNFNVPTNIQTNKKRLANQILNHQTELWIVKNYEIIFFLKYRIYIKANLEKIINAAKIVNSSPFESFLVYSIKSKITNTLNCEENSIQKVLNQMTKSKTQTSQTNGL